MENNNEMTVAATKESKLAKIRNFTPYAKALGQGVARGALWGFAAVGVVTVIAMVSAVREDDETETEEI